MMSLKATFFCSIAALAASATSKASIALGVCAGATSPAEALRGCSARAAAEAARALGARAAGLAAADATLSAWIVPAAALLSVEGASGGVLLSIYLSPIGYVSF
jgi:hypothetical protein